MPRRREVVPPPRGEDPCVVLVRPRYAENVGAAARALENAGAGELRLVAPNAMTLEGIADRVARGGEARLRAARVFERLEDAIADVDLSVATSHKTGKHRRPLLPWELSSELMTSLRPRRTALVFGPEDHGMSSEEVDLCDRLVTIPSHGPLNLAQTVVVLLYEVRMRPRSVAERPAVAEPADPREAPAPPGAVPRIVAAAESALARTGYPRHKKPLRLEMSRLADILSRAPLAEWEMSFLVGMFNHVDRWAAEHGGDGGPLPGP